MAVGARLIDEYHSTGGVVLSPLIECESFGVVVIEAMGRGRPVIGSEVRGIPFGIRVGVDRLVVPPGEPEALPDACRTVLSDRELAKTLGIKGRRIAERRWGWSGRMAPVVGRLDGVVTESAHRR